MESLVLALLATLVFAVPQGGEATSLLGKALRRPAVADTARASLEQNLADAVAQRRLRPTDVDAWIWVGRRTAYLGRFRDAAAVYTEALGRFGANAELLRHRGHRYLTLRQIDLAIADFEQAARMIEGTEDELEADGAPNAKNQPTSTLHFNVWYHLGLARYLQGDLRAARKAFEACRRVSFNPDAKVASAYWLALIGAGEGDWKGVEASLRLFTRDTNIIENHAYLRLVLHFKGDLPEGELLDGASGVLDNPTTRFGLAAWMRAKGRSTEARAMLEGIVAGDNWPAFGFLAAEATLARW